MHDMPLYCNLSSVEIIMAPQKHSTVSQRKKIFTPPLTRKEDNRATGHDSIPNDIKKKPQKNIYCRNIPLLVK